MQIRLTITFLAFLSANILSAQIPPPPGGGKQEDKVYEMFDIQKPPRFPGGEPGLQKFIADSLRYPVAAKEAKIQGVLALSLIIEKDGSLSDLKILKDIGGGCGEETIRLFKSMPKWTPGENSSGSVIRIRFVMPVRFKLDG